jgi:hypothetical protein
MAVGGRKSGAVSSHFRCASILPRNDNQFSAFSFSAARGAK